MADSTVQNEDLLAEGELDQSIHQFRENWVRTQHVNWRFSVDAQAFAEGPTNGAAQLRSLLQGALHLRVTVPAPDGSCHGWICIRRFVLRCGCMLLLLRGRRGLRRDWRLLQLRRRLDAAGGMVGRVHPWLLHTRCNYPHLHHAPVCDALRSPLLGLLLCLLPSVC